MRKETIDGKSQQNHLSEPGISTKRLKDVMVVSLLDDTDYKCDVEVRSKGEELLKKVNTHLNLEESEFFGLLFDGSDQIQYWLDPQKSIIKQIKDPKNVKFKFRVMYYTPDPNSLQEYTRYLFTLQIRRDLLDGRLWCTEETGALLASYIVQGELGNFNLAKHADGYLKGFNFVPNQTPEIEEKIVEYHKSHRGKSPADSDHQMLDLACKLEMYGMTLYPAEDDSGAQIDLSVHHKGISLFKKRKRIADYSWVLIRKLSFKKKKVLLKLHSMVGNVSMISFNMKNRNAAKNFWKICVNHHVFFRAQTAQTIKKKSSFKKGSTYCYSGRTKKEISQFSRGVPKFIDDQNEMYNLEQLKLSESDYNTSANNKYQPDAEDGYVLQIEPPVINIEKNEIRKLQNKNGLEENDNFIITSSVNSDNSFSDKTSIKLSLFEKLKMSKPDGKQLNDESDLGLDTVKTHDFSLEVETMFQKINSEYCGSQGWQYESKNVKSSECEKDESSEPEDDLHNNSSEFTEVDANQVLMNSKYNEQKQFNNEIIQQEHSNELKMEDNKNILESEAEQSNKYFIETEANQESEVQLKQKVIDLYMPVYNNTYDSDSDASVMTTEDESSAFEDDQSLTVSASSSVTSLYYREGLTSRSFKLYQSGDVYNIAKEVLLTERTFVKDLEVITVSLRNVLEKDSIIPENLMKLLYDNFDPLYDFHCSLLAELEERLNLWEVGNPADLQQFQFQKIGDIMHRNMRQLKLNVQYIKKHEDLLLALETESNSSKKFAQVYKEFELSSLCYLSLNSFILKPVQRLLYYQNMLERLTKEYGKQHPDTIDATVAFEEITEACNEVEECRQSLGNLHKLVELERDLVGIKYLVHPKRKFIREGCLHKICRKGPQPRMFFLLSDVLLYTSQGVTATNHFRARAAVPLQDIKLENGGVELHSLYAFTIIVPGGKSFVVAACSPEEKVKWMDDIHNAINNSRKESLCYSCNVFKSKLILCVGANKDEMCSPCKAEILKLENMSPNERLVYWKKNYPLPINISQNICEDDSDDEGSYSVLDQISSVEKHHNYSRAVSTRKVCWHRNVSISMWEYALSIENSLSGTLCRKYKNSSRWQKLWVVFTNFCLYFFKSYEEDCPFARLPLIGYIVTTPSESDVHEEFSFKLQFKTHIYIFRADKKYNFKRWMEVLTIAAKNGSKRPRVSNKTVGRTVSSS